MRDRSYKIVCISLYHEDIATLEFMVAEMKRRGQRTANKSALIRMALDRLASEFAIQSGTVGPIDD